MVANGNAGAYNNPESVGSPATAKNVLAVGALVNDAGSWLFDEDASALSRFGLDQDEVHRNLPTY